MEFLFGKKKKDPVEEAKEWKRSMTKEARKMDRSLAPPLAYGARAFPRSIGPTVLRLTIARILAPFSNYVRIISQGYR